MHLPDMTEYDETCRQVRYETPEHYNFGFDLIDRRAADGDKAACIAVDASGETITEIGFGDLSRSSNRFANVLAELGARRGDLAYVMIARIPAWYEVLIGCAKAGVVAMPATNLLTPKDIEYRINAAKARFAIVTDDNAAKVDAVRAACPSLERLVVVSRAGGRRRGPAGRTSTKRWPPPARPSSGPARPSGRADARLLHFPARPPCRRWVSRDHGYALAHVLTGRYWMDLREDDVHWTLSDTGWAKAAWGVPLRPVADGRAIVLHDGVGFDADLHLRLIARLGVTTFCAPPTAYRMFAQVDLAQYDLRPLRHSLGAGEPAQSGGHQDLGGGNRQRDFRDGYGQTESINLLANYPALPVGPARWASPCRVSKSTWWTMTARGADRTRAATSRCGRTVRPGRRGSSTATWTPPR